MYESWNGTARREFQIDEVRKRKEQEMEKDTLKNIKDNEHIYPFRIKEVRDTIIKVSYLKINRNSVLTDRRIMRKFAEDKDFGKIPKEIEEEIEYQLKISDTMQTNDWD